MTDRVSVIIPTYNVLSTLERAVDSALAQTHAVHEIILIDDCSTDDTRALIATLAARHPLVRPILVEVNRGPSHARNRGLDAATGDWIAILDADDAWKPERLARMLAAGHEEAADIVFDNLILHDLAANQDIRLGHTPPWDRLILDAPTYWANCRFGYFPYQGFKMLARRAFLNQAGLRYIDDLRYGEDMIFYGEALEAGARVLLLAEGHYIYSTRVGAISGKRNAASQSRPNFFGMMEELDRFLARHPGLDPATRAGIAATRHSFDNAGRADAARARRAAGDWLGYAAGILNPPVFAQLVRFRWRAWRIDRRR